MESAKRLRDGRYFFDRSTVLLAMRNT